MEVKVTTFNIQSCKDYVKKVFDPSVCSNAIIEINPEILGLNEVRGKGNDIYFTNQTRTIANNTNFKYYIFGQAITVTDKGPYGNALLSKYPITNIEIIKIPDPLIKDEDAYYESRAIIKANILVNGISLNVITTHVGLARGEQKNAIKTLIDIIKSIIDKNEPLVLLGDFNMTPEDELIDELKQYVFDTTSLIDNSINTFPSINPIKKIDYIFTKNVVVKKVHVEEIVASDHFPLSAVIEL